ncbi:putative quinol monooxygenase [Nocardioides sp.]|uniref:putative quinol monooxygenase n=1 Tax=Nocardioides sp. TaxID=35761 RepID=UPI003564DA7F
MSAPLRVVATIPVTVESVEAVRAGLAELAAASLREEEGCLAYEAFESTSTPGTFVTIESWRSAEDMEAHMSTPHVAAAFETIGPVLAGDLVIHTLDALG